MDDISPISHERATTLDDLTRALSLMDDPRARAAVKAEPGGRARDLLLAIAERVRAVPQAHRPRTA